MNSREFAKAWLERNGLFDKDSDYDGWLGECALSAWRFIASQGHSGMSMARIMDILARIYQAYETPDDPIWIAYWHSDEGRAQLASFKGKETVTDEEVDAALKLMAPQRKSVWSAIPKDESDTLIVSRGYFNHLLNALANQKFIRDVNADGMSEGIEKVKSTQAEMQQAIDEAWRLGMDYLYLKSPKEEAQPHESQEQI